MPQATHQASYNPTKQAQFNNALQNCDYRELEDLLSNSSESIDINQFTSDGMTPIQQAALSGQLEMVQLMIRFGADPNMTNRDGWNTLHLVAYSGNQEITQYILTFSRGKRL